MKIVVLTGSPHKNGTSLLLTKEFIRGAKKANHEVFCFNTAFKKIHPCIGCEICKTGDNSCAFKDDMFELYPHLKEADLVVFVTPVYYLGMTGQLKIAIDRFHAINQYIKNVNKKAMLIATAGSPKEYMMHGIVKSYHVLLKYLGWEDIGCLLAGGCYYLEDIIKTDYPQQAYLLGKNIK